MKIQASIGEIVIKAANLPNVRLISKRYKGKRILSIAQKKPIFYPYKYLTKKGSRVNVKIKIIFNPISGISKLLDLFL